MRRILHVLLLACLTEALYAQKPAQYIRLADEAAEAGRHAEAEALYAQAWQLDSSDFDLNTRYADAARQVRDYRLAHRLYARAYDKDEGKLFPEGLFWLAMMEKMLGEYEAAGNHFRKYAKKNRKKGSYLHDKAVQETEACAWAMAWKQVQDTLQWSPADPELNSPESENAARLVGDQIWFSRYSAEPASGWTGLSASWKDGDASDIRGWELPAGCREMANVCPGRGDEVFFTGCDPDGHCTIWSASRSAEGLRNAAVLRELDATDATSTMPSYAVIRGIEYLFFASDREGGEGKSDIWYSRRSGGEWEEPVNAGRRINTRDDELSPFVLPGSLWFSSDWHAGFGGLDVFRVQGEPGMWSEPVNLGKPVNSNRNDLFFSIYPAQQTCFVSSNREGGAAGAYAACCNDIYRGYTPPSQPDEPAGEITTLAELNRVLPVRLYFHNDEPNPRSRDTTTTLRYSDAYASYTGLRDTYLKEVAGGLSGSQRDNAELEVEDFFRRRVEQGMQDLDLFCKLLLNDLKEGQRVEISIRGFASPRAQSDYNEKLTMRRIASLVNDIRSRDNGAFEPFIASRHLTFRALPFGEYQASSQVSDDLANEKASIYSLGARLERKIEIESVALLPDPALGPRPVLPDTLFDFGAILARDGKVFHEFVLRNDGDAPLVVDSLVASCGCTVPDMIHEQIAPGASAPVRVAFDPFGKKGAETKTVTVYFRGEEPRVLYIRAVVE